ncbi:tetratricopeptide repeat protein 19 homolog, mitochondrial [Daktulosphaira vitifoliae]|uniref:tetratricopeptide repeat protein 19 homolog, mitochondrial n=1 Tax=Daktulosphaira vitifoliae TaxID=58002 RepID=UPI0021A97BA0|nr:tetratricopeptide repeat protein 19 homolog, mitochondrial [Daktulosphaira vitifoliae]
MEFFIRIKSFIPVIKLTHIIYKSTHISEFHHKAILLPSSINRLPFIKDHNIILLGFSLLSFFGIKDEEDSEAKMIDTIKRGLLFLQKEDYEAFEQTLHNALAIANNIKSYDGLTYVYDVLANGALMKTDFANAEKLFVLVMQRLMSRGAHENDLNMLHISLKLSKIYEAQHDFKKCEIGYEHCMKHLEELNTKDPNNEDILGLLSITFDSYARFLLSQGNTKKAYKYFKKSYKTCVKLNGETFEMNVILLNDLGTLSYALGNVKKAFKFFNKAVKIGQHLPDMESFSSVHINLGNIYLKQGLLNEAEKSCIEGMKNAKRHHYAEGIKEATICLQDVKKLMK